MKRVVWLLLLKEKILKMQWLFIALAFTGVLLISANKYLSNDASGIPLNYNWLGLGIISAAFSGLAYVSIVKLKPTDTH